MYVVPKAARATGDDDLTYQLDLTPQGLVTPEVVSVSVEWPKGYRVTDLPEGWVKAGRARATYDDPGLVTQPSFSVTASAS